MRIISKIKEYFKKRRMDNNDNKYLENMNQLREYNKKQEEYNGLIRNEVQRQKFLNKMHNIKKNTYTKKMVSAILFVAIFDIQLSYILAFFDKGQVVEGLSNQLCITILGVSFIYMIRAYFDSKAEHKNLDDEFKLDLKNKIIDKVSDAFNSAGINVNLDNVLSDETNDESKSSTSFHFNISRDDN